MKIICILFIAVSLVLWVAIPAHGDDSSGGVITAGVACYDEGSTFLSTQSTRTPWELDQVMISPPGMNDPSEWDQYNAVLGSILSRIPTQPQTADFAQAVIIVWADYCFPSCNVYVSLKRTFSRIDTTLQCNSGVWVAITGPSPSQVADHSDWIALPNVPYAVGQTDTGTLTTDITQLLSTLNSQPGAQNGSQSAQ